MEVEAAGWLEHAVDFDDPQRHVDEVGEQRAAAQDRLQPADQLDGLLGPANAAGSIFLRALQPFQIEDVIQACFRLGAPLPGVDEGLRLRAVLAALAGLNLEVIALRIEGRVDVAQVNAGRRDLAAEDVEIIPLVELVLHDWRCGKVVRQ